jgi:putative ABC transport system substrate-binding protein
VLEMRIPLGVGLSSWTKVSGTKPTTFQRWLILSLITSIELLCSKVFFCGIPIAVERGKAMNKKLLWLFTLLFLAASTFAEAQQAAKVPRIGFLSPGYEPSAMSEAFVGGLRELGYIEGRNIVIDYRHGEGRFDRLPELSAELVRLKVDVIIGRGLAAAKTAKDATTTIPIVTVASDPVGAGLVASLARPGGNITGVDLSWQDLSEKWLELVKEVVPRFSHVAVIWDPDSPGSSLRFKEIKAAAQTLGVKLQSLEVRGSNPDFESALKTAIKGKVQGVVMADTPIYRTHRTRLVNLIGKSRLPAVYDDREMVDAGGLMSYGPNHADLYRRAAYYVNRILKGAKPADLPVERPTKFELVINLKAAKQIGLTIPPNVLARADRVIK